MLKYGMVVKMRNKVESTTINVSTKSNKCIGSSICWMSVCKYDRNAITTKIIYDKKFLCLWKIFITNNAF